MLIEKTADGQLTASAPLTIYPDMSFVRFSFSKINKNYNRDNRTYAYAGASA